jgi:hypothetical protein
MDLNTRRHSRPTQRLRYWRKRKIWGTFPVTPCQHSTTKAAPLTTLSQCPLLYSACQVTVWRQSVFLGRRSPPLDLCFGILTQLASACFEGKQQLRGFNCMLGIFINFQQEMKIFNWVRRRPTTHFPSGLRDEVWGQKDRRELPLCYFYVLS